MKTSLFIILFVGVSVAIYSQNANDLYIDGISKFDQKKYNDAIQDFNKAIEKNPNFEEAYLKRGACFEILEDEGRAAIDFTKVLEINPKNALAYYDRGLAFKNLNQLNRAIIDFTKAMELDQTNKYAVYNRALVKLQLGDIESACVDLARAADMGVEHAVEIMKYTCNAE